MKKIIISTDQAPAAIGTYSQAVNVDGTVYISGQIPLDPISMEIVSEDFTAQAVQVFANLIAVAEAAGGSLADAVKLNVYLLDLDDFAALNQVMSEHMSEPFPARAAVQVSALPRGAKIEIDAVLCL
ncbi:MAG: reactive intermediate/imine deaminase [Cryomorphaceae bacterium]|jgi:reactive intermediate/imine deaminase